MLYPGPPPVVRLWGLRGERFPGAVVLKEGGATEVVRKQLRRGSVEKHKRG